MACFIVPATEAIVTTVIQKVAAKKESADNKKSGELKLSFADKLKWLNGMLWGGSGLLAFEHVWHGEVTPFFPFLTAANDPADTAEMLHEMATSGSAMAILVTVVWAGLVIVSNKITASDNKSEKKAGATA
ncbi:MAG: hypothetical protein J5582_14075 [Ruminococcus sp.]|uniref:Uncharacterized protein n=1 Tax=Ruminococcus albus TaxID=1264 RepID=A0A1I1F7U6_RUMAL|nr:MULTISPECIES: hypothetical protein [Ruminococcus]MBO4867664.1 hypothetical protein [Ruminococcus sp.]SFB95371.1 hypothetical protein SAMN02910406_00897 [Ruminococcus albus]